MRAVNMKTHLAQGVSARRTSRGGMLIVCSSSQGTAKFPAGVRMTGVGSSVPSTVIANTDFPSLGIETSDEWIASRTGIRRRHVLGEGETLTQHAVEASRRALEMAGVQPEDVDMVLFATSSPDDIFGSACQVQSALGCKGAVGFDLTAACSGFVLGLITGSQFVRTGTARNVLVIGGDALSRFVDWKDRTTCILFGDGCGAVLLQGEAGAECSLLGHAMHSDGNGLKHLSAGFSGAGNKPRSEGASSEAAFKNISMNGQEVFKFAVRSVPSVIQEGLDNAGVAKEQIDWIVMHQANQRILDAVQERFGVPKERVVSNLSEYGNTSAGSVPIALDEAVRANKIQKGDVIAMAGFGAGLTWASAIIRFDGRQPSSG